MTYSRYQCGVVIIDDGQLETDGLEEEPDIL